MYVGGTDIKALHHLIYEVVDNSIDETLSACDRIEIIIHPDRSVTVADNGRRILWIFIPRCKNRHWSCHDYLTCGWKIWRVAIKFQVVCMGLVFQL